jgi:hypothetical protein
MTRFAALVFTLVVATGAPAWLAAQATPERWTLAFDHRIGSLDGDAALTVATGLTVSGDTLYVLQPQDQHIALFHRGGARLGTLGRAGEGPGEFRHPTRFGWQGGQLWVLDSQLRAITFFDPDGRPAARLAPPAHTGEGERFDIVGPLADGTVVGLASASTQAIAMDEETIRLLKLDPETERLDFLDNYRTRGRFLLEGERSSITMHQLISRRSFAAIAPGGDYLVVAHQPMVDDAPGAFILRWISPDGARDTRRYRRSAREMPATARDSLLDHYATLFSERGTFGTHAAARRALERSLHLPDVLPPVTGLFIGSDHSVWVRHEEHTGRDGVEYTVIDSRRELSGSVRAPAGVTLLASDGTTAWGRLVDELDINYVVAYTIVRPNE